MYLTTQFGLKHFKSTQWQTTKIELNKKTSAT